MQCDKKEVKRDKIVQWCSRDLATEKTTTKWLFGIIY